MKETAIEDSLPGIVWKTQSPGGVDIFQFVLPDNLKIKIVNSCIVLKNQESMWC